ncbi:MAG TPA: PQQ-binding-like beta-propeller repeat protein, partial [Planctomycetaceae bacterium]|nr:PQQ-binding-like beta-propeller repeat protein [Planctomycetaceae bacterium]
KHKKNSFASSTPTTDGHQVYVAFADEQTLTLSAYSMDGELNWRRGLGPFTSQHGLGVSPIVFDEMVILAKDMMGPSSIMAFDTKTGETIWSTLRKIRKTSYATPMILNRPGQASQLICVSGASGVSGLNPYTGETIWQTGEFPMRTVASPIYGKGLIIASDGGGGRGSSLWAVDPSGTGDVTETHIKYQRKKELPYVPTPIAYQDWLFLWTDQGIVSCVEIETGDNVWTQRVSDTTVSGSPLCIDGKLYCADESGSVAVVDAAPEFKLHGKSTLGDGTHSTPAVAGGKIFFRTFNRLMCLDAIAGN